MFLNSVIDQKRQAERYWRNLWKRAATGNCAGCLTEAMKWWVMRGYKAGYKAGKIAQSRMEAQQRIERLLAGRPSE